jgi:hypothetical protein
MLEDMQMLILVAVFVLVGLAAVAGWTPDTRSGRDWQPRSGWKPTVTPSDGKCRRRIRPPRAIKEA